MSRGCSAAIRRSTRMLISSRSPAAWRMRLIRHVVATREAVRFAELGSASAPGQLVLNTALFAAWAALVATGRLPAACAAGQKAASRTHTSATPARALPRLPSMTTSGIPKSGEDKTCQPGSVSAGTSSGGLGGRELAQATGAIGGDQLHEPAHDLVADDDLREAQHPRAASELGASVRVTRQIDLLVREPARFQQCLRADAERAGIRRVERDLVHRFIHCRNRFGSSSGDLMAGPVKTEAVVLRSLRYGEADRILHLYTPQRGRIGAIAKGVRRARSRFGGRLEPFSHVALVLHEGRSDLLTVTAADTLAAHARLRSDAASLDAAARACDAVGRLFETSEPHPQVFHLLCRQLALLDADTTRATHHHQLAFRLKLLLAAGLAPHLATCATCGEREHLAGFSGAAGGVVCAACEASSFPLGEDAHVFMVEALGRPLSEAPLAGGRALRQAERAIAETVEHHAHLRLRPAFAG